MLSLPNDGRYPALELTPQQRRQKTLEALFAQVETFARKSPVLMIFEDAHWVTPRAWNCSGNKQLPANIRQDITERTDGIPLFVEEITKAALEAENQSAAGRLSRRRYAEMKR